MNIFQLIGIGITGVVAASILKSTKPELAICTGLATVLIIFVNVIDILEDICFTLERLVESSGLDKKYFNVILKILGISYICEIACSLCRDAGQAAISAKLEMAGKLFILMYSLPIISGFLEVCLNAVNLL